MHAEYYTGVRSRASFQRKITIPSYLNAMKAKIHALYIYEMRTSAAVDIYNYIIYIYK